MDIELETIDGLIKREAATRIFLTNGVKLEGVIVEQDANALILTRDGISQLVLKQAIATVIEEVRNV